MHLRYLKDSSSPETAIREDSLQCCHFTVQIFPLGFELSIRTDTI